PESTSGTGSTAAGADLAGDAAGAASVNSGSPGTDNGSGPPTALPTAPNAMPNGAPNTQSGAYPADRAPENDALARSQQALRQSGLSPTRPSRPQELSDTAIVAEIATALGVTSDAIGRAAGDNLVWVLDEVREPGAYLAANATALSDMIQV